jgi:hypothetical protein
VYHYYYDKFLNFHWLTEIKLKLVPKVLLTISKKKIDIHFLPMFDNNKLSVCEKRINKVYTKLNCASNVVKIIFYFCKCIELFLIKHRIS